MGARSKMTYRAKLQRAPIITNAYNEETLGDYADLATVPCLWWAGIGRGEFVTVDREGLARQSLALVPANTDVMNKDRIASIEDRRGNVISAGPWEITNLIPRPAEHSILLFLERV